MAYSCVLGKEELKISFNKKFLTSPLEDFANLGKQLSPFDFRLGLLSLRDRHDDVITGPGQDYSRLGHFVQYVLHVTNLERRKMIIVK